MKLLFLGLVLMVALAAGAVWNERRHGEEVGDLAYVVSAVALAGMPAQPTSAPDVNHQGKPGCHVARYAGHAPASRSP
ncbi:hypothetical protein [Luteimonas terrae]|uniref:Uncharacterized protein n=1 Tax=Luteimonas terrae TaxID=1530191 RepID=A0ABU1XUK5_9GAMM|nr:hypothetical protein [Luteimonas terrae]MDR7192450.1 hypothetical protein [Luteimonas terrae]